MKTPKESQRTPQINPKCTSPYPYHSMVLWSLLYGLDASTRLGRKRGGLEKNGVLSKERRTEAQKKQQKERATFTNPKHIIYIKGLFFVSDSSLCLSIKRHNNSLLLDVLVFYALDDVLCCCGRLSFAKRRESSSRVLHYYVVVRCVCDWNSRPILLFVQLEEGKTLSKRKSPNARIKRGRPKNTPHKTLRAYRRKKEKKRRAHTSP